MTGAPIRRPDGLSDRQQEKWDELMGVFGQLCRLTAQDAPKLLTVVDAWISYEDAWLDPHADVRAAAERATEAMEALRASNPGLGATLN